MDEIVKELKEDKKHAWEMVSFLKERLQIAEKQGRDEDLHKKMDKILEKMDVQNAIEEKLGYLNGIVLHINRLHCTLNEKFLNLTEMVKELSEGLKHEEFKTMKDTVLRTDGKMQHFREDLEMLAERTETLQASVQSIDDQMKKMLEVGQKVNHFHDTFNSSRTDVKGSNVRSATVPTETVERNLQTHIPPNLECGYSDDELEDEVEDDWAEVDDDTDVKDYATSMEIKSEIAKKELSKSIVKNKRIEDEGTRRAIHKRLIELIENTEKTLTAPLPDPIFDLTDIEQMSAIAPKKPVEGEVKDVRYKCFNSNCKYIFPKNRYIRFRQDGVSTSCRNKECEIPNIIGNAKDGNKWMGHFRQWSWHYQQYPQDQEHMEEDVICKVCDKTGTIYDTNHSAVIFNENSEVNDVKKENSVGIVHGKINAPIYKCYNSNCNHIFTTPIATEEDLVSATCPDSKCRQKNIVAKLREGYRWVAMKCRGRWHFQEIPVDELPEEHTTCLVCGKDGRAFGANDRTAIVAVNLDVI